MLYRLFFNIFIIFAPNNNCLDLDYKFMQRYTKAIYTLSLLVLSSCSVFKSNTEEVSAIQVVVDQEIPAVTTKNEILNPQSQDVVTIQPEEKREKIAKSTKVEIEEQRAQIGPFTAEESASVVLPEFKNHLLFTDFNIKLPELKGEFCYPADGHVTSPYGWRHGRMHTGVDIKAYRGDNIYATFDGVVRFAKYNGAYGNCIVIRHYNGLETMYAHATKLLVKVNQEVSAGDVIALAGRTGRATGDHLHFEVRVAGQCIDPKLILDTENKTIVDKNLYITMRSGRIFASNSEQSEAREEEIKVITSKKYHVVKSGDTLSRIAANNRTTVTNICKMNGISSTSILNIGQRVRVQ